MKQLFFLLFLVQGSTAAKAQAGYLTIINYTDCMITMSVRSHGDGESCATVQSDSYDLYPSGIAFLSPASSGLFGYPQGYAPSFPQTWDALKFGYNSGGCFGGDDICNP